MAAHEAKTEKKKKKNSQRADIWRRLIRNKRAIFSLIVLATLLFLVLFANVLIPYGKVIDLNPPERLQWPSLQHWFGTDQYGRDIFARIVYGARTTLLMGFGATAISAVIGTILGTAAAYMGGRVDRVITRILDTWMAIPALLLTLAIIAGIGVGTAQTIVALAFGGIPGFARVLRAAALDVVNRDYMEAARALGAGNGRCIFRHVVPNVMSQVLIQATSSVSANILLAATLSFLGLGAQPPTPEWGYMLSEGLNNYQFYSYLVAIPGAAIALTALSVNMLGDALRDALDPKLKN